MLTRPLVPLLLAAACSRAVVVRVEWPRTMPAPVEAFPAVCLPEPLNAPPADLVSPPSQYDLLDDSFARSMVHIRDLDPFFAYLREIAAQAEDLRVCLKLLEEQRRHRAALSPGAGVVAP